MPVIYDASIQGSLKSKTVDIPAIYKANIGYDTSKSDKVKVVDFVPESNTLSIRDFTGTLISKFGDLNIGIKIKEISNQILPVVKKTTLLIQISLTKAQEYLLAVPKKTYLILSKIFTVIFFAGLVFVYAPVVQAELTYGVRSAISKLAGADGKLSDLIIPDFAFLDKVKDRDFGIVIPRIYINESIVENVDPTSKRSYTPALKKGIAHAAGTALPGDGQQGYYFAHSSEVGLEASRLNSIFYLLGKLKKGDEVQLWSKGRKYIYIVTGSEVVPTNDVSFLQKSVPKEQIILQTCWPLGTSLKRLIVRAELKE